MQQSINIDIGQYLLKLFENFVGVRLCEPQFCRFYSEFKKNHCLLTCRYCMSWWPTTRWPTVLTSTPGGLMTSVASGRRPSFFLQRLQEWIPTQQLMFVLNTKYIIIASFTCSVTGVFMELWVVQFGMGLTVGITGGFMGLSGFC